MSDIIVARARACVGAPFRPQGRSAWEGLDCIGLAGAAFGIDGLPRDYALRGGSAERIRAFATGAGLGAIDPAGAGAGDLLLVEAGPRQLHLILLTDAGFIHADAGLRRVVEVPGRPPWPAIAAWRNRED